MFSPEDRHSECQRLARQAQVYALTGSEIYDIAVAPAGAKRWKYTSRKGSTISCWGYVEASDLGPLPFLSYSESLKEFVVDGGHFKKADFWDAMRIRPEIAASWRWLIQAHICARLANGDAWNTTVARGFSLALEQPEGVLEACQTATDAFLTEPETVARVEQLVEMLKQSKTDEYLNALPDQRANWPVPV
jgi:hypothetical protein